jgi:hypothetical protein
MKWACPLACVLLASACRQEERTPVHFTEATEQSSTSVRDTAVRPASIVPNPQDTFAAPVPSSSGTVAITLAPLTAARLQGSANLKANGNSTIATVELRFPSGAGSHDGVIHQGRCARPGPVVTDLHSVTTDSLGVGRSATFVDIPLDTLRAKPHALVFGKGGRPHACGEVGARDEG